MGADTLVILIVILVIALMWRGPKTLPKFGAMLGRGVKSAREEARDVRAAIDKRDNPTTPTSPTTPTKGS